MLLGISNLRVLPSPNKAVCGELDISGYSIGSYAWPVTSTTAWLIKSLIISGSYGSLYISYVSPAAVAKDNACCNVNL